MSTSNQAMSVDGLDHVAHIDDLDLVNDAALADPLKNRHDSDKCSINSSGHHII